MFGKIMSISDELMWKYYEILSSISTKCLKELKKGALENNINPRDIKLDLGYEIVSRFYSKDVAEKSKKDFLSIFQQKKIPDEIDLIEAKSMPLPNILKHVGFVKSTSEARRLIEQKALKIDDKLVESVNKVLNEGTYLLKLGKKKFIRVKIVNI
jgi:tyrosyl-tRNA synthetase